MSFYDFFKVYNNKLPDCANQSELVVELGKPPVVIVSAIRQADDMALIFNERFIL